MTTRTAIATRALASGSLVALATAAAPAVAQDRIRTETIKPGFVVLSPDEGSGNTIVARGAGGTFLVDTMADSISDDFMAALDAIGVDDVRFVANTHWHQNHLGGNDRFSASAVVLGPVSLRERLGEEQRLEFLVEQTFPALPRTYWPNVTFTDAVSVHLDGERVDLWHVIGHTDTDVIVYWTGSRIAATGDLWRPGGWIVPDIDTGGSLGGVEAALAELLEHLPDDAIIVPGHGRPGTVRDLAAYVDGLRATLDYVETAAGAGRDLRQIVDEAPDGLLERLGPAAARLLEAAYRSR